MIRHLRQPAVVALSLVAAAAVLSGCSTGRGYSIATTAPSFNQDEPTDDDGALVFIADGNGGLTQGPGGGDGGASGDGVADFGTARYAAGNMLTGPFSGTSSGLIPALLNGGGLTGSTGLLGGGLAGTLASLAATPAAALSQGPSGGANLVVASLSTQSSRINPSVSPGGVSTGGGSVGVGVGTGAVGIGGPAVGGSVSTPGVGVGSGGVSTGVGLGGFVGGVTGGALGITVGVGPSAGSGGVGGLVSVGTTSSGSGLGGLLNR